MREGDMNNWYIELYEEFPCENKNQLTQREGQVIREIGTLNMIQYNYKTPSQYKKEWRQNAENKEKEKERLNSKKECECGALITYKHISKHKKSKKHLVNLSR